MSRYVSTIALLLVLAVIGVLFYRVMAMFVTPLFLGLVLVVIFRPMHLRLLAFCRGRQRLAALLTTLAILVVVLAPTGLVVALAASEGTALIGKLDIPSLRLKLTNLRERVGLAMPHAAELAGLDISLQNLIKADDGTVTPERRERLIDDLEGRYRRLESAMSDDERSAAPLTSVQEAVAGARTVGPDQLDRQLADQRVMTEHLRFRTALLGGPYRGWLVQLANPNEEELRRRYSQWLAEWQSQLWELTGATTALAARMLLGACIMIVSIYFFFADGPAMLQAVLRLSPLDPQHIRELVAEFDTVVRAVVAATLLAAVGQGLLAGFGFWLAGIESVFLLMLLTTVVAMIPFVGAVSVWLPVSLWVYFYDERTLPAVFIFLYGALVVSVADNLIKPLVLHGQSRLHPLLALLSVLGGIQALGPIGIVVGPMAVSFLWVLLKLLHRELITLSNPAGSAPAEASEPAAAGAALAADSTAAPRATPSSPAAPPRAGGKRTKPKPRRGG